MNCPECHQPIPEGMCYECGAFFETPEFEVHDIHNYNTQHQIIYKKRDHFKEVLSQLQGKEMREIPDQVIQCVRKKLPYNLEHVSDLTGINVTRIILRKSKLSKYNENAHCIWAMASNRQPPYIKKLVEDESIRYFKAIAQVYEPLEGDKRNSFLNYYYVLYKLLHLMKEFELLNYVPLLRTRQRITVFVWSWIGLTTLQFKFIVFPNFGRL